MSTSGIKVANNVLSDDKSGHILTADAAHPAPARILDEAAQCLAGLYGGQLSSLSVERLIVGVFFTGVKLSNGCAGVAYTPPEMIQRASTRILKGQMPKYHGMMAAQVLSGDLPGPFADVIRLATLNALSVPFFQSDRYAITSGDDLSGFSQLFQGKRICMVGAIIPLLKRLSKLGAAEIVIVDKKKETQAEAGLGHFVPVEETASALSRCQMAVFTGASIANGSIETLLGYVPEYAAVAVVGPTAGFIPEPLFLRKVALVGTVVVTDGDQAMEILSEGGGAYHLFGSCVRKINLINRARVMELQTH
jgi:uncharacterized protein (DUF4213/DUF364 family)